MAQGVLTLVFLSTVRMSLLQDVGTVPWEKPTFMEKPTTNRDYWTVLDQWVVRVHGASRTQPFQPLHESFPLQGEASESLCPERVTVCFYTGRDDSVVRGDKWNVPPTRESRAMWKNMGQWTGFTFFKRKTQHTTAEQQEQQDATSQPNVNEISQHLRRIHLTPNTGYARGCAVARGQAACSHTAHQKEDVEPSDGSFEVLQ